MLVNITNPTQPNQWPSESCMLRLATNSFMIYLATGFIFMLQTTEEILCYEKRVIYYLPHCSILLYQSKPLQLERKTGYELIPQMSGGTYEIYSPQFHAGNGYPNNTYCVWNVANSGLVGYHIMNQQLQEPKTHNCEGSDCDCPDSVKIKMGRNEHKLCGSTGNYTYQMSSNGLHVKFCSDNKQTAKGINIFATKSSGTQKRETKQAEVSY